MEALKRSLAQDADLESKKAAASRPVAKTLPDCVKGAAATCIRRWREDGRGCCGAGHLKLPFRVTPASTKVIGGSMKEGTSLRDHRNRPPAVLCRFQLKAATFSDLKPAIVPI
jgi:hypothetical protein